MSLCNFFQFKMCNFQVRHYYILFVLIFILHFSLENWPYDGGDRWTLWWLFMLFYQPFSSQGKKNARIELSFSLVVIALQEFIKMFEVDF